MAVNLPGSDIPDVREYVYVDTDRVRSLLAQMADGAPDEKAASTNRSSRLRLGMRFGSIESDRGSAEGETLSLADLHVSMMEEAATALGLLADISDQIRRSKDWLRGKVRARLQPGMLLRITAPTLLLDPGSLMDTMRAFETAVGEGDDDDFAQMLAMLEALYGPSLAVSIRPTNTDDGRAAFVGAIPADHQFTPMVRELLLSRIGPDPTEMTSVIQIARIPTERETTTTAAQQLAHLAQRLKNLDSDRLDRELLDNLVSQMSGLLEQHGFAAAPKWPAISIMPLAIYRNVLPTPPLGEKAVDD